MTGGPRRMLSIALAVLLVTGTITPAVMADRHGVTRPHDERGAVGGSAATETLNETLSFPSESSIRYRTRAIDRLSEASLPARGARATLGARLNETTAPYIAPDRVNESVFAVDAWVVARTQVHAPDVARDLVRSDRRLAAQAVQDAARTHERLRQSNVSYNQSAVTAELAAARRALDRGAYESLDGPGLVRYIEAYRQAWIHAQRALDIMDEATTPRVSFLSRADPPRENGSVYQLRGTVVDVRTTEITNVTVRVDNRTVTVPVETNDTAPLAVGRFAVNLTLPDGAVSITVNATDPNRRLGGQRDTEIGEVDPDDEESEASEPTATPTETPTATESPTPTETPTATESPTPSETSTPTPTSTETPTETESGDENGEGPPDDENGGPPDDENGGPPDNGEGPPDDENGGPPDNGEGQPDEENRPDNGEGPPSDENGPDNGEGPPGEGDGPPDEGGPPGGGGPPDDSDDGSDDGDGSAGPPLGTLDTSGLGPETGTARLLLDEDRLPGAYEQRVTKTDPLDPDSNSARTNATEADDGTIDGLEDFDNDSLLAVEELVIGTDPVDPDTDDDKLRDPFEVRYDTLDPLRNDTDGDGVPDAREDPDNETLVNLNEQRNGTNPLKADTDADNLTDADEVRITLTDPTNPDSDSTRTPLNESGDGVADGAEDFDGEGLRTDREITAGTDPFDRDTDDDRLTDLFELTFDTLDPLANDTDGDGVPDAREDPDNETLVNLNEQRNGTSPLNPDTDADGLTDAREIREFGTDPLDPDTDGDRLIDSYEVRVTFTDPTDPDSDSTRTSANESNDGVRDDREDYDDDGLETFRESEIGTNPLNPDTDGDRLRDGFESTYETIDPLDADTDGDDLLDAREDPDEDTLVNLNEQRNGTNPLKADTDADNLTDATEVRITITVPTDPDSDTPRTDANEASDGTLDGAEDFDADGLNNSVEVAIGTNPFDADTDGDGLRDGFEFQYDRLDPLDPDSNDDGVNDGRWDPDNETLINVDEQAAGTNPFDPDTDDDRLTDAFERNRSQTDPLVADSNSTGTTVDEASNGTLDGFEDFDGDGLRAIAEQRLGTDPLAPDTDGDGLRDAYEVNVTLTDPLVNDSDSTRTDANEAGNGIPDGAEDFDDDTIETRFEDAFDTDPFDADTDGDRLRDGFEVRFEPFDPLANDTNGDSVPDARTDGDDDGLRALGEQRAGTDPTSNDTDFDGLSDGREVNGSTSAIRADTDDDGLDDGEETQLPTDPTNPDTDGDGVADGNETFTTTTANESAGASVAVSGQGNAAADVTVSNSTVSQTDSTAVGSVSTSNAVTVSSESNVTNASLSLSLSENVTEGVSAFGTADASDEETQASDVAIYRFDREAQTFVRVGGEIDTEAGVVTANVSREGTYVAFDSAAWRARFDEPLPEEFSARGRFGNSSVWDCAGPCDRSKNGLSLGTPSDTSSVSLGKDGSSGEISTEGFNNIEEGGGAGGGSGTSDSDGDGIIDSNDEAPNEPEDFDGVEDGDGDPETDADGDGIPDGEDEAPLDPEDFDGFEDGDGDPEPGPVDSDGDGLIDSEDPAPFDRDADDDLLFDGIDPYPLEPDGDGDGILDRNDRAPREPEDFDGVEDDDGKPESSQDTDGDGLNDAREQELGTDPSDQDTDGDGLSDGSEVDGSTDPLSSDTDGDGLSDQREVNGPTDPTSADTDADGLGDATEIDGPTDPTDPDTDGDGVRDGGDEAPLEPEDLDGYEDGDGVPEEGPKASRTFQLPENAESISLSYLVEAQGKEADASVRVTITSPTRSVTVYSLEGSTGLRTESGEVDLSNFAGEVVTVSVRRANDAYVSLRRAQLIVDSDGDGLSDNVEENGLRIGNGERVFTNPFEADTDGDGIPDGEEVERRTNTAGVLGSGRGAPGAYFELRSDPTEVDSDGDGLTDREELTESHRVVTTTSVEDSRALLAENDGTPAQEAVTQFRASGDPLYADTDRDGLNDLEERLLSTDPTDPDTDGDSISDGREARSDRGDPTVHDVQPPEVRINQAAYDVGLGTTEWFVRYTVIDQSRIERVEILREGEVQTTFDPDGSRVTKGQFFEVGTLDSSIAALAGASVDVRASDVHGNTRQKLAFERSNFYGNLAGELDAGVNTPQAAEGFGRLSGFSTGFGKTARESREAVELLLNDPLGFLDSIGQLLRLLQNLGVLERLLEAIAEEFQRQQRANNPYDRESQPDLHREFAVSYYEGYIASVLASSAIGGAASKTAGKLAKGSKFLNDVRRYIKSTRTAQLVEIVRSRGGSVRGAVLSTVDPRDRSIAAAGDSAGSGLRIEQSVDGSRIDADDVPEDVAGDVGEFVARNQDVPDGGVDLRELAEVQRKTGIDDEKIATRLANARSNGRITDAELERIGREFRNSNLERAEVRRLSLLISDKNDRYLFDDDIDVRNLLDDLKKGQLKNVRMIVKPDETPSGTGYVLLRLGGERQGWIHTLQRHLAGLRITDNPAGIWPLGQRVKPARTDTSAKIPDEMNYEEINDEIFEAVKKGNYREVGRTRVYQYEDSNIDKVERVCVYVGKGGKIETAYPQGEDVTVFPNGKKGLTTFQKCPLG